MNYKGPLSFVVVFLTVFRLFSQIPVISCGNVSAERGSVLFTDIKVSNFKKIVGLQFSLSWDPEVIEYKGLTAFGIELNTAINFGTQEVSDGFLIFSWYDGTLNGISLPDETILFKIEYEVIGDALSSTELRFVDQPAPREIVDTSYKAVPGTFQHGSIAVLGVSSLGMVSSINRTLKIYPNPMVEYTGIEFDIETDKHIIIDLIDQQGRVVSRQKNRLNAGKQNIALTRADVPINGMYRVVVSGENFFSTQNLMVR
jgi:hypothetical protein